MRPQKRRVLELISFSSWQLDAVNSVPPCLSSLAVHNWTVTFTLNKDNLPLEKGDFCTGTRQVLCTRCCEYIEHKREPLSTNALHQHQKSKKCRLEFVSA
jgi:hypothetical protein